MSFVAIGALRVKTSGPGRAQERVVVGGVKSHLDPPYPRHLCQHYCQGNMSIPAPSSMLVPLP